MTKKSNRKLRSLVNQVPQVVTERLLSLMGIDNDTTLTPSPEHQAELEAAVIACQSEGLPFTSEQIATLTCGEETEQEKLYKKFASGARLNVVLNAIFEAGTAPVVTELIRQDAPSAEQIANQPDPTETVITPKTGGKLNKWLVAGKPNADDYRLVYGPEGYKMTWPQRIAAGVTPEQFQSVLAAKKIEAAAKKAAEEGNVKL